MKIYTKTGDAGKTALFGGSRVAKDHLRVSAYGEVDELNAVLGLARAYGLEPKADAAVARVQSELFTLGAELATPNASGNKNIPKVQQGWVELLEHEIDAAETGLPPLKHFILPGGSPGASWLHLARTVCRRSERAIVALSHEAGEEVGPGVVMYVNRLSDWLFVMARAANLHAGVGEVIWNPRQ